jgi:Helicase conserved C-terminal domain/PLD-like domain/SNF2-related domain
VKPEFVDNREITLAEALKAHLDWLHANYKNPSALCVATGYFNPEGFLLVADRLDRLTSVRLLLGAEPIPPPAKPLRMPGDPPAERFEAKLVAEALEREAKGLERDRNLLEFSPETDKAIRRLLNFLASGKIEVRRYEKSFLHGKAYLFDAEEGVLAGSSNFTAAGLTRNLELNLGRYDPTPVRKVKDWFEKLWAEAVPYDLASLYKVRFEQYDPYLIYLRVLWERYKNELEDEAKGATRIPLTTFQNDGIFRAQRILDKYNGVLIADGVGLGKMFIGGELVRQAVEDRRQRALLIAPAALRDGTWRRFADRFQLYIETVSYEELANDTQLGGSHSHLSNKANDYALVIVDEAQAFRNPDTDRAKALRRLLQGRPPKRLVLLSATPVNNSLWDLYYLLTYFIRHDAEFADLSIRSLRDLFAQAMKQDPDDLKPDALFDILDATAVRRTRHFVQRFYPNDRVKGPGGKDIPVRFPDPHVEADTYSFDTVLPGFFDEIKEALAPENGNPKLTLGRYAPSRYLPGTQESLSEAALVGLLRSGLLKRFESSAHAFAETTERMARANDVFLDGLQRGFILTADAIEEWEQVDSDEAFEELIHESGSVDASGYDVARLRADVEKDRDLLRSFSQGARLVTPEKDPKLRALDDALLKILQQADKDALDEKDLCDKRKVIVFSFFADTVEWIYNHLSDILASDKRFASYRNRVAAVAGDESYEGVSRRKAMFGFAPETTEAPPGEDQNVYDILITTDVLAEGVNLQQCRNIINYDLPWNPMRLVQRHGRIDRIGSPHKDVYIRCFFPDRRLEELLELEGRIRRKLAQAAASVGVENEVIPGAATSDVVFAETREEIERLRSEDPTIFENAGEDPSAHSGEEYRQELRKGLDRYDDRVKALPWGAGSGFAGGAMRGHFFCARVGERLFLRFVPWDSKPIIKDTLTCLRLITCREDTPRMLDNRLYEQAFTAWRTARGDIFNEWTFATDPANLQPRVRPSLRAAANHLRRYPPSGMSQEELDRLTEAIEAPWGPRIERQIRTAMESGEGLIGSAAIAESVKRLGLEPFQAPAPLPPIQEEDVRLICWLAVESA